MDMRHGGFFCFLLKVNYPKKYCDLGSYSFWVATIPFRVAIKRLDELILGQFDYLKQSISIYFYYISTLYRFL